MSTGNPILSVLLRYEEYPIVYIYRKDALRVYVGMKRVQRVFRLLRSRKLRSEIQVEPDLIRVAFFIRRADGTQQHEVATL